MNRHIVPALALAAACTTVGACTTDQNTGDNPATGVSVSPTIDKGPVDPHTTVVDDTAAPQGYTMDSINQMIQDQEAKTPASTRTWSPWPRKSPPTRPNAPP